MLAVPLSASEAKTDNANSNIIEKLILGRWFVPLVLAAAVALRLVWLLMFLPGTFADSEWYYLSGESIAAGEGYSPYGELSAYRPVGYPAMLGVVFSVTGVSMRAAQALNLVMSTATLLLAYDVARRLFQSEIAARLTLLLFALYPNNIAYTSLTMSEIALLFWLMFGMALFLRLDAQMSTGRRIVLIVITGLVFGAGTLVKPQIIFIPGLLWLLRLPRPYAKSLLRTLGYIALLYAVLVLTLIPWTIRNYQLYGRLVFISNNGGYNLLIGNNPYAIGKYYLEDDVLDYVRQHSPDTELRNDAEIDAHYQRLALDYIRSQPLDALRLVPLKFYHLYRTDTDGLDWNLGGLPDAARSIPFILAWGYLSQGYYVALMAVFIAYTLYAIYRRMANKPVLFSALPLWIIAYLTAVYLVYFGGGRFHFPMMPFVIMVSAAAVAAVLAWRRPVVNAA